VAPGGRRLQKRRRLSRWPPNRTFRRRLAHNGPRTGLNTGFAASGGVAIEPSWGWPNVAMWPRPQSDLAQPSRLRGQGWLTEVAKRGQHGHLDRRAHLQLPAAELRERGRPRCGPRPCQLQKKPALSCLRPCCPFRCPSAARGHPFERERPRFAGPFPMGRAGLEPATLGLKVPCSTS
jgi:hypothetical protein